MIKKVIMVMVKVMIIVVVMAVVVPEEDGDRRRGGDGRSFGGKSSGVGVGVGGDNGCFSSENGAIVKVLRVEKLVVGVVVVVLALKTVMGVIGVGWSWC